MKSKNKSSSNIFDMITSLKQNGEQKNKSIKIDTGQGTWVCLVNREQLYIYKINDSKERQYKIWKDTNISYYQNNHGHIKADMMMTLHHNRVVHLKESLRDLL